MQITRESWINMDPDKHLIVDGMNYHWDIIGKVESEEEAFALSLSGSNHEVFKFVESWKDNSPAIIKLGEEEKEDPYLNINMARIELKIKEDKSNEISVEW